MKELRYVKKLDGIRFILDEDEFNTLIVVLMNTANYCKTSEKCTSYGRDVEHVCNVLTKISYFDEEERVVRCILDFGELECLMGVLLNVLPESVDSETNFDTCIADPGTKKWVNRNIRESDS